MSDIEKMASKSVARNFEKQTNKIMGYLSHSSFDPQPIIVNELIDYCVRSGLIIASSIINDIIDGFETESSLLSGSFASLKTQFNDGIYKNIQLKRKKIPKSSFLNTQLKFATPK